MSWKVKIMKFINLYMAASCCLFFACHREVSRDVPGTFREPHRPQFHFSPPTQWMNDPNGMVFYEGEYHLFYQHYPDSNVWGPMHWGHAVSTDLVHWQHLPIALYPDSLGYIFSGSAVIDHQNTSGLGQPGNPPMVAIFTYHNPEGERAGRQDFQYQGIAYSLDKGRSWTKYPGNPVIPNTEFIRDFRDPKVIWHEPSRQWIMVFAAYDHVKFWGSKNLLEWNHLSDFGHTYGAHTGVWECPDLFPLEVKGSGITQWVLLVSINPGAPNGGSGTQYFIGNFDGKEFVLDKVFESQVLNGQAVWLDYGRDNYAGVTWSDAPHGPGERLFLGWMSNWDYAQVVPTTAWRSAMTLPRVLHLNTTSEGYRLATQPHPNLLALRGDSAIISSVNLDGNLDLTSQFGVKPDQLELILEMELPKDSATWVYAELSNAAGEQYRIGYSAGERSWFSDRTGSGDFSFSEKFAQRMHYAPRMDVGDTLRMHLFLDVASAELFADGGATTLTEIFFPFMPFDRIQLHARNGRVGIHRGVLTPIRSIWK